MRYFRINGVNVLPEPFPRAVGAGIAGLSHLCDHLDLDSRPFREAGDLHRRPCGVGLLEVLGVTLNKKQIRNGRCLASLLNIS